MSGVAAVLNGGGAPVDPACLERIAQALEPLGPDGHRTWTRGPAALVHAHFWITPEEHGERPPITAAGDRYAFAGDVRLDNRDELLAILGPRISRTRPTDADLVLAAYLQWGADSVRRLLGDFAFIVYDAVDRRLFAARDVLGVRPLFYAAVNGSVAVASTLAAVLAAIPDRRLNLPYLRDLGRDARDRWADQTPYVAVARVPPGHALVATPGGVEVRCVDRLSGEASDRPAPERDRIERFAELFAQSVRARLRSAPPVGVLLSGGLDSSAIACQASRLMAGRDDAVRTYSAVFERTPTADEHDHLDAVLEHCPNLTSTRILSDDTSCFSHLRAFERRAWDEPVHSNLSMILTPLRAARQDGCRAVLPGFFGDELTTGDPYGLPALWRDFPRHLRKQEWPHFRQRRSLARVVREAYFTRTSSRLRAWAANRVPPGVRRAGAAASFQYRQLTGPRPRFQLTLCGVLAAEAGVECRFPFLDRRLLEYTLTLPVDLRFRGGVTRRLFREAFGPIYPRVIRERARKSHFDDLDSRGAQVERDTILGLLRDSRVVAWGLGSRSTVEAFTEALSGRGPLPITQVSRFLSLEAWLRQFEQKTENRRTIPNQRAIA